MKKKKTKKKDKAKLSFAQDEDESELPSPTGEEDAEDGQSPCLWPRCVVADFPHRPGPSSKKRKVTKNPTVDTSFLPDREREERERFEREELRREWIRNQELLKKEDIEITYSYWDGAGHRRVVSVSIFFFLLRKGALLMLVST